MINRVHTVPGILMVCGFVVFPNLTFSQELTGTVTAVIDGDTIAMNELRIRLCGIDAPEDGKTGAHEAQRFLELAARGKLARCIPVGGGSVCDTRSDVTNNGRVVAQCFVDGEDMADMLTREGLACDWPKFSGGAYDQAKCSIE
ncbi:thermonuclease family protein [Hoeflea alexandrii]|uniref:thermonuclease family protein n=1 Tax=Hoeflea alexandrii TaxID=288436 RepID=UPI0035CFE386